MVKIILNSFLFWGGWIIIPFIMEIVPALGSVFLLIRRNLRNKIHKKELEVYPEITLIIPVYNSADTLYGCIRSINDSTYPNNRIRIFLVNNKGKDNSFDIYAQCQQEFPELLMQWMNSEQGKSRALNLALYNSDGKYIINLDSDGMLEKNALVNMITRFENDTAINCMTGSILTVPEQIKKYKAGPSRLLRELEFMESAQAFLAGRNFQSEFNNIFTLSGAFSAFRRSTIMRTNMYNTDTVCEDTHVTFQIRDVLGESVVLCSEAIFYVDPIEDVNRLYIQRQRWQRGEIEVVHMFMKNRMNVVRGFFSDFIVRLVMFDHTFAFPRMIWYFALICLGFVNYPFSLIIQSVIIMYMLYVFTTALLYICISLFLKPFKKLRRYYVRKIYLIFLLPLYNFVVFWFRFAGIINSMKSKGSWKMQTFSDERDTAVGVVRSDFLRFTHGLDKVRRFVNYPEDELAGAHEETR